MKGVLLETDISILNKLMLISSSWYAAIGSKNIKKIHPREINYCFPQKVINEFKLISFMYKNIINNETCNKLFSIYALDVHSSLFQFLINLLGYYNNNTIFDNLILIQKYEERGKENGSIELKNDKFLNQILYYNNKEKVFTKKIFGDLLKNSLQYRNGNDKYYYVNTFNILDEFANPNSTKKAYEWYEDIYKIFKQTFYIFRNNKIKMKKYLKLNDFSNVKTSLKTNNALLVNYKFFDHVGVSGDQLICFKSKNINSVLNNKIFGCNLDSKTLTFNLLVILIHYQILASFYKEGLDNFNKINSIKIINLDNMKEKIFYLEDVDIKIYKFLLNNFMSVVKNIYNTSEKVNWSILLTNIPFFRKIYRKNNNNNNKIKLGGRKK